MPSKKPNYFDITGTKTEDVKVPSQSSASSSSSSTPAQKGSPAPEGANKATSQVPYLYTPYSSFIT